MLLRKISYKIRENMRGTSGTILYAIEDKPYKLHKYSFGSQSNPLKML